MVGIYNNGVTTITKSCHIPRNADIIEKMWSDDVFELILDSKMTFYRGSRMVNPFPLLCVVYNEIEIKCRPSSAPVFIKWKDLDNFQEKKEFIMKEQKWQDWVFLDGRMSSHIHYNDIQEFKPTALMFDPAFINNYTSVSPITTKSNSEILQENRISGDTHSSEFQELVKKINKMDERLENMY
jgi:hypothetical protein